MNAENFREYLTNPSLLYQVPYEELKTLALEYPYNAHLRWLLLQKSRMDHRTDVQKTLEKAAVYSIDRRALHHFVQSQYGKAQAPLFVFNEDFLELKDLLTVQEALPAMEEPVFERTKPAEPTLVYIEPPVFSKPEEPEEELTFDFSFTPSPVKDTAPALTIPEEPAAESLPEEPVILEEPVFESLPETLVFEPDSVKPAHLGIAADAAAVSSILEYTTTLAAANAILEKAAQITHTVLPAEKAAPIVHTAPPMSKASFRSWMRPEQHSPAAAPTPQKEESTPPPVVEPDKKIKKPTDIVVEIARQSVTENAALATETLADLLAAQQQFDKAAKMYERLIMKFPEKSAYFAAKIEKLKRK